MEELDNTKMNQSSFMCKKLFFYISDFTNVFGEPSAECEHPANRFKTVNLF